MIYRAVAYHVAPLAVYLHLLHCAYGPSPAARLLQAARRSCRNCSAVWFQVSDLQSLPDAVPIRSRSHFAAWLIDPAAHEGGAGTDRGDDPRY